MPWHGYTLTPLQYKLPSSSKIIFEPRSRNDHPELFLLLPILTRNSKSKQMKCVLLLQSVVVVSHFLHKFIIQFCWKYFQ